MKLLAPFAIVVLAAGTSFSASITLPPSKDNTLFESTTGTQSSGAGQSFFAGRTGVNDGVHIRRGLVAFDLAPGIPADATIIDVRLTLFLAQGGPVSFGENVSLFTLTSNWGEGTSVGFSGTPGLASTGDATWLHRFFNTSFWSTPGGDFEPQASATTSIGSAFQFYSWTGPGLVDDVQNWITNPASNFGWIIRGDETGTNTALRFSSREAAQANRPQLTIVYDIVPEPSIFALCGIAMLLLPGRSRRRPTRN